MDQLSLEHLGCLIEERAGPCVSLYLTASESELNGEALRRQLSWRLRSLEPEIAARGGALAEFGERLECEVFSRYREGELSEFFPAAGLALFCSPGFARGFQLPLGIAPATHVGSEFYLLPVVPYLEGIDHFYLLAFGQDVVRLYHANSQTMREVTTGGFPSPFGMISTRSSPWGYELSSHAASELRGPDPYAQETCKYILLRMMQQIDAAVGRLLRHQRAPLVLACVGYLAVLYDSVNSYPYLAAGKVPGAPELWTVDELQSRAWRLVQPWYQQRHDRALAALARAAQVHLAANSLEEIVRAAEQGSVETLLLPRGAGEDLLNSAAIQTLAHGGAVMPVDAAELPDGAPAAAILRGSAVVRGR